MELNILNYPVYPVNDFEHPDFINYGDNMILHKKSISVIYIVFIIYLTGVFVSFTRSFVSVIHLLKLKKIKPCVRSESYTFILMNENCSPFSCFNWIFISEKEFKNTDVNLVIEHEKCHAYYMHTLDLILTEFLIAVLWFNPFVYFFRSSIKAIHEYQVDSKILGKKKNTYEYLRLLYTNTYNVNLIGITSTLKCLTIKNRINMITTKRSNRIKLLLYIIIVPVITVMTMALSNQVPKENVPEIKPINEKNIKKISGYGMRIHPISKEYKMHYGIDFSADKGTPIVATAQGTVVKKDFREEGSGYGRMIIIQHDDIYSTLYSQMSAFKVDSGDIVKKGQVIGLVGSSGISTGPHLHYEVHKNGERVNPAEYFK